MSPDTPDTKAPLLSIVVGTYNRLDQIRDCVESIRAQTKIPYMIYVTDAGSTDGTIEYLKSVVADDLEAVLVGEKLGQARAYNDVFARVTSPYVCWISDDNVIVDSGLDKSVAILRQDPRIGMVGLKVQDQRGPFVKAPYIGGISPVGILNVNQGVLPTPLLKRLGGFNEAFRDYGIDPDLTAKVLFSGHDIVYTRDVAIHHYRNWSEDPTTPEYQALRKRHENAANLYTEKYGGTMRFAYAWMARKTLWYLYRRALGKRFSMNSRNSFMGLIPRDWHNLIAGRFTTPLEALGDQNSLAHLRQHCPRYAVPANLPQDPPLSSETVMEARPA